MEKNIITEVIFGTLMTIGYRDQYHDGLLCMGLRTIHIRNDGNCNPILHYRTYNADVG